MANNTQIKNLINEKITSTGTGAITGSVLNNVLTQMVLLVGQGRAFAGIATPSGTPSTYDRNVFWLATAAGTYTNFGGLVIPEGLSVILYNEVEGVGSYSFNTLIEIDDEPTSGSNNLVSSGTVYTAIQTAIQAVEQGATEIYDVSSNNNGASYSTLTAALALVPQVLQKGGISIKYKDSTSGKYVQYRLISTSWSTNLSDWENAGLLYNGTGQNTDGAMTQKAVTDAIAADDVPTIESENLIKSGAVANINNTLSLVSGKNCVRFYYSGAGGGEHSATKDRVKISVKKGDTITFKFTPITGTYDGNASGASIRVYFYKENGTQVIRTGVVQPDVDNEFAIAYDDISLIGVYFYKGTAGIYELSYSWKSLQERVEEEFESVKADEIKGWIIGESFTVTSASYTDGVINNPVSVSWPDGKTGTLTLTRNSDGLVTQIVATHGSDSYTLTITRNSDGNVTTTSIN